MVWLSSAVHHRVFSDSWCDEKSCFISNIFRGVESWNVEKYFLFYVPILMVSDGLGLDELQCAPLCEFNMELNLFSPGARSI